MNKCGNQLKFNWCGYLKKFKQWGVLVQLILRFYSINIIYKYFQIK